MPFELADLYDDFAADYERTRVPRFRPFIKRLLQNYDTRPGSHVLDAGCGTGLAATMVAPRVGHGGRVLGIDKSAGMLDIARQKAQGYGFTQCEFIVGDIAHVDAADESFDLILCSFALWDEPNALFAEFHRLLKPHGALLAQNWSSDEDAIGDKYNAILYKFVTGDEDERVRRVRAERAKHAADWADLKEPQEYEGLLRRAGFGQVNAYWYDQIVLYKTLHEFIEFYDTGGSSRLQIGTLDPPPRELLHDSLLTALQPFVRDGKVEQLWRVVQVNARK